jgi:hypothetical protein
MGIYRADVSLLLPQDENGSSFRNVVFSIYLELRTIGKIKKASDSEN